MIDICPRCGGVAILIQARNEFVDVADPTASEGRRRILEKVEEFRCQEQECEHEFEKVIREPTE